jgi:hypothetical protein
LIRLKRISGSIDDGEGSTLQFKGFRSAGSTETLPNFITSEDENNAAGVFGKIATSTTATINRRFFEKVKYYQIIIEIYLFFI